MTENPSPPQRHIPDPGAAADRPAVAVPAAVHAAFQRQLDELGRTPEPGELWRLEHRGVVSLGVVIEVEQDDAVVVPVGEDPQMADAATVLLDEAEAPLGLALGVWVALETVVPRFVFDLPLGQVRLLDDIGAVRRWVRTGAPHELPAWRLGAPISSDADPRVAYRAHLRDDLLALAEAGRLRTAAPTVPRESLGDILRDAGLRPADLERELGWPRERALRAFSGQVLATDDDIRALAQPYSLPEDRLLAALPRVPPRLDIALHDQRWRPRVRLWAWRRELPEPAARERIADEVVGARLRRAGADEDEPDWDTLLADFFRDDAD